MASFSCGITGELCTEPTATPSGNVYEKKIIEKWIQLPFNLIDFDVLTVRTTVIIICFTESVLSKVNSLYKITCSLQFHFWSKLLGTRL